MKTKLKQIFVAGLTALALTYGCAKQDLENIVLSESSKSKVVMFGESHNEYRKDNDFVINILPKLKEQGYKYLALELVREPSGYMEGIVSRLFTDYISGKITRKDITPSNCRIDFEEIETFATGWLDLIDEAKELGMKVVLYDANHDEHSSFNKREEVAFKNLKELIFNKDPEAKAVIYCGRRHINEKEVYDPEVAKWEDSLFLLNPSKDRKFKSVAYHLNKYTQGKTLTVSLKGSDEYVKYCDIDLDLDENKCLRNKSYSKEE